MSIVFLVNNKIFYQCNFQISRTIHKVKCFSRKVFLKDKSYKYLTWQDVRKVICVWKVSAERNFCYVSMNAHTCQHVWQTTILTRDRECFCLLLSYWTKREHGLEVAAHVLYCRYKITHGPYSTTTCTMGRWSQINCSHVKC
jgi:hypothetical protein